MDNSKVYFAKAKEGAIIPSKREEDGAFDIYACLDVNNFVILPHQTRMVPTGLNSAFSNDYVAILKERGSSGTKGIGQRAGVIDSGYRGEWFVPITNHNDKIFIISKSNPLLNSYSASILNDNNNEMIEINDDNCIIYPYDKAICQAIMVEVPKLSIEELSQEEIMQFKSERGTGALGSSGK